MEHGRSTEAEARKLKHGSRSTEAEARKQKLEAVKHGSRSTEAEVEAKKKGLKVDIREMRLNNDHRQEINASACVEHHFLVRIQTWPPQIPIEIILNQQRIK